MSLILKTWVTKLMTRVKPPRKVTKGMSTKKDIQGVREGNRDQITQEGNVLSGVEKFHSGTLSSGLLP